MKKKNYFLLLSVSALALTGCGNKLTQTADTLDVELGTDLQFNTANYFNADENVLNELVVDTSKVDTNTVGTGTITVAHKNDRYTITVNVKDTTAPVIQVKEELPAATVGDSINAVDYIDIDDLSDCKAYFSIDGEASESITYSDDLGEVQIFAKDSSDNQSESVTVDLSADAYPELAVREPQVTYDESTDTYSYTDEWYGNFISMTNEELNGLTKNFVNAVIQGVLEDRSGDKGENVVASWEAYKGLFEEAGIWESMKAEAVADNKSDTAPAVNPVQPSNSNTNSNNSSSSSSSSKDNASTNSGDNFDNQGYMTPEEQKAAMRDLAEEWGASSDWNVQFGEDNDTNTWTDSGATYIDEDGRIHFD